MTCWIANLGLPASFTKNTEEDCSTTLLQDE